MGRGEASETAGHLAHCFLFQEDENKDSHSLSSLVLSPAAPTLRGPRRTWGGGTLLPPGVTWPCL